MPYITAASDNVAYVTDDGMPLRLSASFFLSLVSQDREIVHKGTIHDDWLLRQDKTRQDETRRDVTRSIVIGFNERTAA